MLGATSLASMEALAAPSSDSTMAAAVGAVVVSVAVAAAAGAAVLGAALWLRRRRRTAVLVAEMGSIRAEAARLGQLLDGGPLNAAVWDGQRAAFVVPQSLARSLGVAGARVLGDLAPGFEAAGFGALESGAARLVREGVPFSRSIADRDGRRRFAVDGRIGGGLCAVWFRDATTEHAAAQALRAQCQALDADRDRLQEILDALDMPVWRRGPDLALAWVNAAHRAVVERPEDAAPPGDRFEIVPNLPPREARSLAHRARERGAPQSERRRFVVGGQRRSYELTEVPLDSGDTVGFGRDVTDRDNAVGELARHAEAHLDLLNRMTSAVAIFGGDRRLTFFNDAFVRLWSLPEAWLERQPTHDEVLERLRERRRVPEQADFPAYKRQILGMYTSLTEPDEDLQHLPDGTALRVVTSPHPLGGLVVVYDDVTDRFAFERARTTQVAVQRATFDHLFEAVAVIGSDGRLKLFNPAFRSLWKLDGVDLAGEPHVSELVEGCRAVLHDPARGAWDALRDRIIDDCLERHPREGRLTLADGRAVRYASIPLPDGGMLYTFLEPPAPAPSAPRVTE
jgi:PAS domain-containing protein